MRVVKDCVVSLCRGYYFSFAAGDFDNGAAVVQLILAPAHRNRFDAAVGSGGDAPEKVYMLAFQAIIK